MSPLLVAVAGDAAALAGVEAALADLAPLPGGRRVLLTWTSDDPTVAPPAVRGVPVDTIVDLGELLEPGHPDSWHSRGDLAERGLVLRALAARVDGALPAAGVDVIVSTDPNHPATASLIRLFPEAALRPEPVVPDPAPALVVRSAAVAAAEPAAPAQRSLRAALLRRVRSLR